MKNLLIILYFSLIISIKIYPGDDLQQSMKLGSYKITHINDGGIYVQAKSLYPQSSTNFWENNKDLTDGNGNIYLGFGGFLIETENRKIVMDLGVGPEKIYVEGLGNSVGGSFLKNLEKAGVKPEDITDVFFSHLHQDNVGWATIKKNGKYELTFPKANYICNEFEWERFVQKIKSEESEINKDLLKRIYEPLKDKIKLLKDDTQIAPNLRAIYTSGHSPGLTILKLDGDRKTIYFTSDFFHTIAEFKDGTMFTGLDYSKFAEEQRIIILPEFCRPYSILANARFGKYVFGKLIDKDRVLTWEPCLTKECKYYYDGDTLAFQEEDL